MNRPEQCLVELLYKQTRGSNRLDYSTEIGGIIAWITVMEPGREQEIIDRVLGVLCDPCAEDWDKVDIEEYICPPIKENAE